MEVKANNPLSLQQWLGFFGLSLLAFTAFLDFTIINSALPEIQRAFNAAIVRLQWISNIYGLMLVLCMVLMGHLADRFGRRRIFYFGMLIFLFAAIGCGLSESLPELTFYRGLQGFGAASIYPVAIALLGELIPDTEYPRAISIYSAITGLGLTLGPLLGGTLVHYLSWRWIFFINIPIILLGFTLCLGTVPKSLPKKITERFDHIGLGLLMVGLSCIIFGVIEGARVHFQLLTPNLLIIAGALVIALLVKHERRIAAPIFYMKIFSHPGLMLAMFTQIVGGSISTAMIFFDPLYLATVKHLSVMHLGLYLTAIPCMQVAISLVMYRILRYCRVELVCLLSTVIATLAILGHLSFSINTSFIWILINFLLVGTCWGIANTAPIILVNQIINKEETGNVLGTLFTLWNLGGTVLLALSVATFSLWFDHLYQARWNNHQPALPIHHVMVNGHVLLKYEQAFMSSFHCALWFILTLLLIALTCSYRLFLRCHRQRHDAAFYLVKSSKA